MCRVLRIARSSWYAWRIRRYQINLRQQFRHVCDDAVSNAFAEEKQRYGALRLAVKLPEYNLKTIAASLEKCVETRLHLQRSEPEINWRHHYLHTDEGWLYLAMVIDLWSRAVIG